MSVNLTDNAVAAFERDAKDAYQQSGILRNAVRTVTGVEGSTFRFNKIGKGLATPRIPQTEVVPMGLEHTNESATLEDWIAAEYTDVFNEQKVPYSERKFLAATCGRAIGRREDQLCYDALALSTPTAAIIKGFGSGGDELNLSKIRRAKRSMDENGVPPSDRFIMVSAGGIEQMLGDNTNTSRDFSSLMRLRDGEMGNSPWLGFNWLVMEDRAGEEGGYTLSTNDVTTYAWHKNAVGLAVGKEAATEVSWQHQYTSWLTTVSYIGGATHIDNEGIVSITYDQSVAV
jgi:hypothetical protein